MCFLDLELEDMVVILNFLYYIKIYKNKYKIKTT